MLTTALAAIFVLGVLIFVHELGHFLAAKKIGIRVERFSLGFPPKLIGKKIGDTEYCVSWIPLGGYVKMAGEQPDEEGLTGAPYEFQSRKVWERMLVVFAGPAMNFITAVLIFWGIFSIAGLATLTTTEIGGIEEHSLAAQAGVQVGDKVLAVGGSQVNEWNEIYSLVQDFRGTTLNIDVDRHGQRHTFFFSPEAIHQAEDYTLGLSPFVGTEIGSVKKKKPAHTSGLKPGDVIVSIDGQAVHQWDDMAERIHAKPGVPISVQWTRGDQSFETEITPEAQESMDAEGNVTEIGLIGIGPKIERKRVDILTSFWLGIQQTVYVAKLTVTFVKKLILRQISPKFIGGPIIIAQMAGETARAGLLDLFGLMALLSINLAFLNILPIPILDGGHLLFLSYEGITRKSLSLRQRGVLQQIGFAFLILLMVYVTYNDILKLFK
ncbi:MAG: RIP metalloprotease RseP [Gemmatimonadota bacterium]|nr:MAG: RIP metalloprotease RseP [Gemmatimonadota bacterium]